jgi:hypothetical protein
MIDKQTNVMMCVSYAKSAAKWNRDQEGFYRGCAEEQQGDEKKALLVRAEAHRIRADAEEQVAKIWLELLS